MRVFLDTNVVMDYLSGRGDVEATNKLFEGIIDGMFQAYVSTGSFYTLTYLTERTLKAQGMANPERLSELRRILTMLLSALEIVDIRKQELKDAIEDEGFLDLEDSYQLQAARVASCDCLITDNIKDFPPSDNPYVLKPRDFLKLKI